MNIIIPDSWLREHLKTNATPKEMAKCLSLCSQSVEKLTEKNRDWIYEIEITTNRPDCLSIYGIARELAAILPRFGIKARLGTLKETSLKIPSVKNSLPLQIKIQNFSLCPRFTAIIFDKIVYRPSPKIVRERLEKSGTRALNNVVDISNYLMLELGQPMHTFDYDKVNDAKMILRESAGGEKLTTLDGQTRVLPEGTIIIEDGQGRIIDLCGVMGGENSAVDENTKKVLLFVQTYNPMKIRKACQTLGFQTEAAQRFEKGVDPEGVIPAIKKAIVMFEKNCNARVTSNLIDIYPNPPKEKRIKLTQGKLNQMIGVTIELREARKILESLGFETEAKASCQLIAKVPSWRHEDMNIPEDLIEEIARIYGYFNLPSVLPEGQTPQEIKDKTFAWEEQIKEALRYWGFAETANYSMVSLTFLENINFETENTLKISNPLTKELVYLRPSLIPSLLEVMAKNKAETQNIRIFEMANTYLPKKINQLPEEVLMLSGIANKGDFYELKGVVEKIFGEMGVPDFSFEPYVFKKTLYGKIFHPVRTAEILVKDNPLGVIGELSPLILKRFGVNTRIIVFELNFQKLIKYAITKKRYQQISKYPAILEDFSFVVSKKTQVGKLIQLIKQSNPIIQSVELIDSYKDTRTFRITYQSAKKTLNDKEVGEIRKKIIEKIKNKFRAEIKV